MTTDAKAHDQRPSLGPGFPKQRFEIHFEEWARIHGVLNIGLQLVRLIRRPFPEQLLGGILRFLAYRDTHEVLKTWSQDRPMLQPLVLLSESLLDFPVIRLPLTSETINKQFKGHMDTRYLAVQFSTRRAPDITPYDQLKITCLRTWLLIKALGFAEDRHLSDLSLKHLCTQLRMALDGQDTGKKLAWFLRVTKPALSIEDFERALQFNIKLEEPMASGTVTETIRSFQFLLEGEARPDSQSEPEWYAIADTTSQGDDTAPIFPRWGDGTVDGDDSLLIAASDDGENEIAIKPIEVADHATPPQALLEARSIALQSPEDFQYLPHSWNRLRTDELAALRNAIQQGLAKGSSKARLLAAVSALALCTRRSMHTIQTMRLATEMSDDWQIDLVAGQLHRKPSRRHVRWSADAASQAWIRGLATGWEIKLHPSITDVLLHAYQHSQHATTVGQLWPDGDQTMESAFNTWCADTPGLGRVSSGLLVRQAEQIAFDELHDHTYAQLISSPARAGIPGSGAYPSWTDQQVEHTLGLMAADVGVLSTAASGLNALGSELDPDDQLLRDEMARQFRNLSAAGLPSRHWVDYHNALVGYGVVLLLSATGARPVTSVFETVRQFDTVKRQIFITDKVSKTGQDGTSGRLVPMPSAVAHFLTEVYFPYLNHLAQGLRPWFPAVAHEVQAQASGVGSDKLPLFFLFKRKPEFDWVEVSESSLRGLKLISWPLPLNLFRHRLATRLRSIGLSPELIDAQLGHAEAGSETFSDRSPWCWQTAEPAWTESLERSMLPLDIQLPTLVRPQITPVDLAPGYGPFRDDELFGQAVREQEREARKQAAVNKAKSEILAFVGNRPVDSIHPAEWDRLGRQMLLTDKNLRQPNALIRHQVFEEYIQREWRQNGQRPRLRNWLATLPKPQTLFGPNVIGASDRLDTVRSALDEVHAQLTWPVSKNLAGLLSAMDLCLFGRVNARHVIEALAHADTDCVRMVLFERRAYVEYSEQLSKDATTPVQRYALTTRCARHADLALSAGKSLGDIGALPPTLHSVATAAGIPPGSPQATHALLRWMRHQVAQENACQFPGIVSGVLSGRLLCYALPSVDWIRVQTGHAHLNPQASSAENPEPSTAELAPTELIAPHAPIGVIRQADRDQPKQANRAFLKQVRSVLTNYLSRRTPSLSVSTNQASRSHQTNTDTSGRRDARAALEKILAKPDPAVSVAVHALGNWVLHLLYRPYRKGLLDVASIQRYLDTLAHGFVSFGCEVDLVDLDEDELTEFYRSIVDDAQHISADHQPAKGNQQYVVARLEEFHRFAVKRLGLAAPNWSEIAEGTLGSTANPGTILEAEYLHAIQSLCPAPAHDEADRLRDAFILLLTFRFGLRGSEAIGLRRNEWVEVSGAVVVLVSSRHRQLKTRGSQRQVPLLETLTDHENMIVRQWLGHWASESGNDPRVPLFFRSDDRYRAEDMRSVRTRIIQALRVATCADHTTLHHARHAFANRIGAHLFVHSPDPVWPHQHQRSLDCTQGMSIRRLLLGTEDRISRRTPWALARLLGHASPATTFQSYLHSQFNWAEQLIAAHYPSRFGEVALRKLRSAVSLDKWQVNDAHLLPVTTGQHSPEVSKPCQPSDVLKYSRLRAQGVGIALASEHCKLSPIDATTIEQVLARAGTKLLSSDLDVNDVSAQQLPRTLLAKIQSHRWQPLIDFLEKREAEKIPVPKSNANPLLGQQVGKSRQILLWAKDHFVQMRQFMEWMQCPEHSIGIYRPERLDPIVLQWAEESGFFNLRKTHDQPGKKKIQIDVASETKTNQPAINYPSRLAFVSADNAIVNDNYELIMLWLAFSISQQCLYLM